MGGAVGGDFPHPRFCSFGEGGKPAQGVVACAPARAVMQALLTAAGCESLAVGVCVASGCSWRGTCCAESLPTHRISYAQQSSGFSTPPTPPPSRDSQPHPPQCGARLLL